MPGDPRLMVVQPAVVLEVIRIATPLPWPAGITYHQWTPTIWGAYGLARLCGTRYAEGLLCGPHVLI